MHSVAANWPSARTYDRSAFTLIELLVVVSIIAVLAAMLLPAMGKAREMAKRTVCAGNLKQISTAMLGYSGEQGSFPVRTGTFAASWPHTLQTITTMPCGKGSIAEAMEDMVGDRNVFFCPSNTFERNPATRWIDSGVVALTYQFPVLTADAAWTSSPPSRRDSDPTQVLVADWYYSNASTPTSPLLPVLYNHKLAGATPAGINQAWGDGSVQWHSQRIGYRMWCAPIEPNTCATAQFRSFLSKATYQ